jgi:hypothetical protein
MYLVRSLRTAAHIAHERALVKALATGQNLAVTDVAYDQLRAAGALVEEELDEFEEDTDLGAGGKEEVVLDEKAALPASAPASMAVDLPLRGKGEWAGEEATVGVGSWMTGRSSATNTSTGDNGTHDGD